MRGSGGKRKEQRGDWIRRRGRIGFAAGLLLVAVLWGAAASGAGPDIAVTDIEFGIVAQPGGGTRPTLSENQAILGDTVRVRAVVKNVGDVAAGVFQVEFYFIEKSSLETDKINTATVFGLAPGEELKPAVTLDTSSLGPGIYEIVVKADPAGTLSDSSLCNNEIPRDACGVEGAKVASDYLLTLLQPGPGLSDVAPTDSFPVCRMGPLTPRLAVDFYNLGTTALARKNLRVDSYYRTAPGSAFTSLAANLSVALTKSQIAPGENGQAFIFLNYDELDRVFASRGLGVGNDIQLKLTIQPLADDGTSSSVAQEVFLPSKRDVSTFYSAVDLWTFPERPGCATTTQTVEAGSAVKVAPTVGPDGLIYHITSGPSGNRLYALNLNGEELWSQPFSTTLTSVTPGRYDEEASTTVLYFGTSDGKLIAARSRRAPELETSPTDVRYVYEELWTKTGLGGISARPVVSSDRTRVAVGSAQGLYVFDETGTQQKNSVTTRGPVSQAPLFVGTARDLWFASGSSVHKVAEDGTITCTHEAGSTVTTSIETSSAQSVVYFGTLRGFLWAVDAAAPKATACKEARSINLNSTVRGLTPVRESRATKDLIFVTTDDGYVHQVSYDPPNLSEKEISDLDLKLINIRSNPAVMLSNGNVAAVLIVSSFGELRALSRSLDKLLEVEIWGDSNVPFQFDSGQEMTAPVVNTEGDPLLLIGSADGYLYAFDLSQLQ